MLRIQNSFLFLGAVTLGVVGCAKDIRRYTYPPNFTYIERKELSSAMWKFAVVVADLNALLENDDALKPEKQGQIAQKLKDLEAISGKIGTDGGSNHPYITEQIPKFQADIERARRSAEQHIPNYYLAGRVAGSCASCHMLVP